MKFSFTRSWLAENHSRKYLILFPVVVLFFAVAYSLFGEVAGANSSLGFWTAFYFSVVTITTLGFGDISPIGPVTRSLVSIEAVSGLLLIGAYLSELQRDIDSRKSRQIQAAAVSVIVEPAARFIERFSDTRGGNQLSVHLVELPGGYSELVLMYDGATFDQGFLGMEEYCDEVLAALSRKVSGVDFRDLDLGPFQAACEKFLRDLNEVRIRFPTKPIGHSIETPQLSRIAHTFLLAQNVLQVALAQFDNTDITPGEKHRID